MRPGAIFDMDGVLVDSSEAHFAAWHQLGEEVGRPFTRELFERTFGMHNNQIVPLWIGPGQDVDALADRKEQLYRERAADLIKPLPGCVPLLQALHAAGFGLAVGSSGPRANIEMVLDIMRVRDLFHALSTGEDVTHGKPDPEVFLVAARRLGLPPAACIVLEDAPQGVEAGRRAGMAVVAITSSRPRAALQDATLIVDSLEELTVERLSALERV
ncbi:MAG: HAD family hydrolase [Candidatus Xenobia bacterium]